MSKITTRIERLGGRSGKHWAKLVTRVDTSKSNGYAFVGDWVNMDETVELPVGAVILAYDAPHAIAINHSSYGRRPAHDTGMQTIRVLQAFERGVAELERLETEDRGWALQIRPIVESALPNAGERYFKLILSERQLEIACLALETLSAGDPAAEAENKATLAALNDIEEVR